MKKITLAFLFFWYAIVTQQAQQISFSFTANYSCEHVELDSVLIENLSQGGDTILYFPDTVLSFFFTGIEFSTNQQHAFYVSQNFPNPYETKTDFDVFIPVKDYFTINVNDLTGRQIASYQNILEIGMHNFTFYSGKSMTYILAVISGQYLQHIKLIQFGQNKYIEPQIKYNGVSLKEDVSRILVKQKTAKSYFPYTIGDELKFTAFTTNGFMEIINTPTGSYNYVFDYNNNVPLIPTQGINISSTDQIIWNWDTVANANGYAWNTVNNYSTATDIGASTTFTQTGLDCDSTYTLYVWAYNNCGESGVLILSKNTASCPPIIVPCPGIQTIVYDGYTYNTVQIDAQCWLRENLRYLPSVVGPSNNSETVPYYYVFGYNGTNVTDAKATSNYQTYGVLYNWAAAMNGQSGSYNNPSGVQGVCPSGWHLPSYAEWEQLINFLGGETIAGGKMKATTLWASPNTGATNESGFSAFPGGYRYPYNSFSGAGNYGYWWSASGSSGINTVASFFSMGYNNAEVVSATVVANRGFSVRCVKN